MPFDSIMPSGPGGWAELLAEFYLIPEGAFLGKWNKFMVTVAVLSHLLITFQACFHHYWGSWFILGYLFDVFFLVDIFFKTHTAYLQGGFWVVFPSEMRARYFGSREFKFDIISNFPYDIFALFGFIAGPSNVHMGTLLTLMRLPKIMRTARVFLYFKAQEQKLHADFSIQILKFVTSLVVLTHTIACAWYTVAYERLLTATESTLNGEDCFDPYSQCAPKTWFTLLTVKTVDFTDISTMYNICLYWTVTTMTTTGYGEIHATNDLERIYAFMTMTVGIFFYGYVSGTIASALSNMDSRRVAYQQKMDAVKQYMSTREMDEEMQARVVDYYDYVWERNRGIDVKNLFEDMPITFRSEVALSLNNQIIDKASIFHNTSIGFRRRIAMSMRLYLFTANEFVVHKGDLGLEMYFITQGRIDIYTSDDVKIATASLIEGGHFGEYGIVLGHRHDHSAKAICNTDIYVLTREDLASAFTAYPEDKEKCLRAAQDQLKRSQENRKQMTQSIENLESEYGAVETPGVGAQVTDSFIILDKNSRSHRGSKDALDTGLRGAARRPSRTGDMFGGGSGGGGSSFFSRGKRGSLIPTATSPLPERKKSSDIVASAVAQDTPSIRVEHSPNGEVRGSGLLLSATSGSRPSFIPEAEEEHDDEENGNDDNV